MTTAIRSIKIRKVSNMEWVSTQANHILPAVKQPLHRNRPARNREDCPSHWSYRPVLNLVRPLPIHDPDRTSRLAGGLCPTSSKHPNLTLRVPQCHETTYLRMTLQMRLFGSVVLLLGCPDIEMGFRPFLHVSQSFLFSEWGSKYWRNQALFNRGPVRVAAYPRSDLSSFR